MSVRARWSAVRAEIACPGSRLRALAGNRELAGLRLLLKGLDLAVVTEVHHVFANEGLTYVAILKESHFAIHTWPEHDLALLDLFVCTGNGCDLRPLVQRIAEWMGGSVTSSEMAQR
jgi:S-adenosylmethionine/arginine decarboxylase-like enzyme